MKKFSVYTIFFILSACVLFYGVACWTIYKEVRSICQGAKEHFDGDEVEATIALLESETSFVVKNRAVWALGQIGDPRALPALQDQLTAIPCEKPCPKHKYVCQYGLETAIKNCSGEFSLTRWMYRFL